MRRIALLAVLALVAAGCGESGENGEDGSEPAAGTPIRTITVDETEFALKPGTINVNKPGTYSFEAVNKGNTDHALEIEGEGVEEETEVIGPGESATLTVELEDGGTYELYCPVGDHKDRGMEGRVAVGASAGTPTETTETEEKSDDGY